MSLRKKNSPHTHPTLFTLGLTGLIGSGKSYVSALLAQRGLAVYDCDQRAKELYDEDPDLHNAMTAHFGERLYATPTGKLDRQLLAQLIFGDSSMLAVVNALVHPAVRKDFATWRELYAMQGGRYCIIESAILLQASLAEYVDAVVVVSASESVRLDRAIQRDRTTAEALRERMRHQLTEEKLLQRADFVMTNEPSSDLPSQIELLLSQLPDFEELPSELCAHSFTK